MICYKCGQDAGWNDKCPVCGADLSLFKRAIRISNSYYNDGLQKAQVRNLSGALSLSGRVLSFISTISRQGIS